MRRAQKAVSPFRAGIDARYRRRSISENPHTFGSQEWYDWLYGYLKTDSTLTSEPSPQSDGGDDAA